MKENIIYRVQVLYYEEFCGCFGDTVVFEAYYTTEAAAKKKIKELNKQLKKGTFEINKDYTFHGEYRNNVSGLRAHFKTINDKQEAVLFCAKPYHDLECLHMPLEPEKIYIENADVEETEVDDDYDGTLLSESSSGKLIYFAKPKCDRKVIADAFGAKLECEEETFAMYCNDALTITFNEEDIDVMFEDENDNELRQKVKEYFLNEGWKENK